MKRKHQITLDLNRINAEHNTSAVLDDTFLQVFVQVQETPAEPLHGPPVDPERAPETISKASGMKIILLLIV